MKQSTRFSPAALGLAVLMATSSASPVGAYDDAFNSSLRSDGFWSERTQNRSHFREAKPRLPMAVRTVGTACVRRCDGYYFPVSYSTRRSQLDTDAARCEQACPMAETLLMFHNGQGLVPELLRSAEGEHYTELPTAFRYRTELDPACACHEATELDPALGRYKTLRQVVRDTAETYSRTELRPAF